ncbi:MAG TPA: DUF1800 domain-containing protein [Chthoniobacterales bacterium]|jgi:uncharacterized protein (DUF1800 family)
MLTPLPVSKWNEATAAHLLNRAGFGGTPSEIEAVQRKGPIAAVRDLVDFRNDALEAPPPEWARPRNLRQMRMEARMPTEGAEQKRGKMRELKMMEGEEILSLRQWWLERMLNSPAPLLEKMTLFWHGHFATSVQKVRDAYFMWRQNDTLRRNALGSFATLVKQISRDPAMMIYLDLQQSRKEHPNENWARELMELFTIGIGNYSEQDIREAARAFTGYRVDMTTQQFRFAPVQQDRTSKTFMGRTGVLTGDDVIDILVGKPACAQFIGRKLWRFFVEDDPPAKITDLVAERIRAHNFEFRPVLREIFSSDEFYSDRAMSGQIKSPVQYVIQTAKLLEAPLPSPQVAQNAMRQMGQTLFAPPNVKGWDGGKAWITTSTLMFRFNFANYLINGDAMLGPGTAAARIKGAGPGFRRADQRGEAARREPIEIARLAPPEIQNKPDDLIERLSQRLYQTKPAENDRIAFRQYLESKKTDMSDQTIRGLLHLMMSTPQFQLI